MKFLKHNLTSVILVSVLVISILTLLFAASISYRQIRTLNESQALIVKSYKIYVELEQLNAFTTEAETGQRGFILTKDSTFLEPYHEAINKVKWSFARLKLLTEENPGQRRNLDTLVYLVNQRFVYLNHLLNRADFQVHVPDSVLNQMRKGQEMMRMTLAKIDRMVYDELQLLKQRELAHKSDLNLSPFTLLFIVLFSICMFVLSFYKINRDFNKLARTSNQLIVNNEIFQHSEHLAGLNHWYWDIKQNKISYSLNLFSLLGCNPGEFEPTFDNFIKFVHPADRHLMIADHEKILRNAPPALTYYRIIRKDGELRHFKSTGKLITSDSGTNFTVGINADITEEYKKDTFIREKISDLERSNRQMSAFNHIASHDLQEPLRKIQTFISRIQEDELASVPAKVKEYLSGVRKEVVRMQKFITDLLLYSRTSKAEKTFRCADLNEILENSKKELSHRIEEKNAVINSGSRLPVLLVIPFQIQQLFSNLLSNSIKYSKAGITPVINIIANLVTGKEIPDFRGEEDSKFYKISFSDNGIGFDPQYADRIFTLFYRLHNNNEYTGTGIGLAICRLIAENHKGYILAEGNPGAGSTFNVYLPVRQD